jgi:hypothetical protein
MYGLSPRHPPAAGSDEAEQGWSQMAGTIWHPTVNKRHCHTHQPVGADPVAHGQDGGGGDIAALGEYVGCYRGAGAYGSAATVKGLAIGA